MLILQLHLQHSSIGQCSLSALDEIKGLRYLPDFVTIDEGKALLQAIDDRPWSPDLSTRRVQHYGYRYDYRARQIDPDMHLGPLPDFAQPIVDLLGREQIFDVPPDQVIVNDYQPGQGIGAHVDCVPCFGNTVASLSLGSACEMEFQHRRTRKTIRLTLAPWSLLVLTSEARYDWTHAIAARRIDNGQLRARRVSLTFRNVIVTRFVQTIEGDVVEASTQEKIEIVRGTTDGANCAECPFSNGQGQPRQPVVGEGPKNPLWVIVGESPGTQETQQNRPFIGQSGKLVGEALNRIKVERHEVWITNSACCQPSPGANEVAKKKARECCASRLKSELSSRPNIPILALGAHAAQGFCGDKFSITQMSGACYRLDVDGTGIRDVIPSVHPAAILRGGDAKAGGGGHTSDTAFWNLVYDAQKVNLLARGRDIRFKEDIQIEATDFARAERLIYDLLQDVRRLGHVAVDTETYVDDKKKGSALSPITAKMNAIGLATTERAISIAWVVLSERAKTLINAMLGDETIIKIAHNKVYDEPVLKRHKLPVFGRFEDTMLQHHSAFPGMAHGLQRVATQFFAMPPWKAEFRFGQDSIDELLRYCAIDTLSTARINVPLAIIIKKSDAEKTYEIDLKMAQIAAQMHLDGYPISREVNERLRVGFKAHIDTALIELQGKVNEPDIHARYVERLAFEQARRIRKSDPIDLDERIAKRVAAMEKSGGTDLKIDSGDHVVAFLRACGVPLTLQTKSGKISTKKDILESFVGHPIVRSVLTYRENKKLLSTFVERMFDRVQPNGSVKYGFADMADRVHPRWSVNKITSRWGSEAPSSQNWSKDDKKKGRPNLRSQVVAPPRRNFVAFDAKQLEARLIALKSGDPFLMNIFQNDRDIHSEFARIVWPDFDAKPPSERKVLRDLVKRPEYCLVPGTRVLKSDDTWAPIETLDVGDMLIGFDVAADFKSAIRPAFNFSRMMAAKKIQQPCYRIVTTEGEITASDEHLWRGSEVLQIPEHWMRTDALRPGHLLSFTQKPWSGQERISLSKFLGWPGTAQVLSVEFVGEREVIALQTSTENFIAEGFLSHNCSFYGGTIDTAWQAVVRDYPNVTLGMIGKMVAMMRTRMPGVAAWHQNEMLVADRNGEVRSMILGRRRVFPIKQFDMSEVVNFGIQCLRSDQRVQTTTGNVPIAELDPAKHSLVQTLRNTNNYRVHAKGTQPVHRLTAGGRTIVATENHRFLAVNPTSESVEWKRLGDLFVGDHIAVGDLQPVWQHDRYAAIDSILYVGEAPTYDIEVFEDGDHSYIAEGIVTHNSSGADLINLGLAEIMPLLPPGAFPILQIHDAVVFECWEDDTDLVKQLVIQCFTREVTYDGRTMHFPVDAKSGKSWDVVN